MRPLGVLFHQPALCNYPCFIQFSDQIRIQSFCPVRPLEPFDNSIFCRLTRLNKFELHVIFFSPLCQCQRDQFWSFVHLHLQRVAAVYHDPVQHPVDPLSRDIQIDFYRQSFTVKKSSTTLKVRKRLPQTSVLCGPTLV